VFYRKYWNVLIVDDEPDIHELSKLLLKKEEFFGAKLKLHHAYSGKEALQLLQDNKDLFVTLAVALVDVVMETDHAGLDFCRAFREQTGKLSTALILRTGQPGQAPPRQIIDEYNVSTYMTKVEATSERLYVALKSGIQHYYETSLVQNRNVMMHSLRVKSTSAQDLLERFAKTIRWEVDGAKLHAAHDFFGQHYVGAGDLLEKSAYDAIKEDLLARAGDYLAKHRVAKVDNYLVVQTKVLGTDKLATLVVKDAVYPRDLYWHYGNIWRESLAYIAEVLYRGSLGNAP
jgi:CheY-like chemotaxis protein